MPEQLKLSDASWSFRKAGEATWLAASVPGCVHTDLHKADAVPDPFWADNEAGLQWIDETDWEYRCTFDVDVRVANLPNIDLVCEGLDTLATVTLNGVDILSSDNMFHSHRVDVKRDLRLETNVLEIRFANTAAYLRATAADYTPPREFNDPVGGCVRLRKQQSQFGWDWGPRFVTCGVWRPIYLEGWSHARIADVAIEQRHENEGVTLIITPECRGDPAIQLRATISREGLTVAGGEGPVVRCVIVAPDLWWPAGQGAQPLYEVRVEAIREEVVVDCWTRMIGLKTVTLDTDDDGFQVAALDGRPIGRFGLRVNGRLIFAKGANWIPAHSFVTKVRRTDYADLIQSAVDANMNMLRVWGGGVYENDAFYELCDQYGLLVWQDFMFACTLYPAHDAFLSSVRREVSDQVRRLRHHPSIALWCGNNEITLLNGEALQQDRLYADYERLFLRTIPEALGELDRSAPYIHSSPAMGVPGRPDTYLSSEDAHDWKVWHDRYAVEHYEGTSHRFLSEFGMQSYPSVDVAVTFCPPGELNVFSPAFDNHQKNVGGNQVILDYVSRSYRFPRDYDELAYLSQLNQALCMRVGVEHARRSFPQTLGALYWQLNDCWPVASWSSLEFGGRWKALHYAARRFYAPTLLSLRHLGRETRSIGNYVRNDTGRVELHLVHDGPAPIAGVLCWGLRTLAGEVITQEERTVQIAANSAQMIEVIDVSAEFQRVGRSEVYLTAFLRTTDGEALAEATTFFVPPRSLALRRDPIRSRWVDGALELVSDTFHHAVRIDAPAETGRWSDQFFDLHPGQTRRLTLSRSQSSEAFPENIRVRSLIDSF